MMNDRDPKLVAWVSCLPLVAASKHYISTAAGSSLDDYLRGTWADMEEVASGLSESERGTFLGAAATLRHLGGRDDELRRQLDDALAAQVQEQFLFQKMKDFVKTETQKFFTQQKQETKRLIDEQQRTVTTRSEEAWAQARATNPRLPAMKPKGIRFHDHTWMYGDRVYRSYDSVDAAYDACLKDGPVEEDDDDASSDDDGIESAASMDGFAAPAKKKTAAATTRGGRGVVSDTAWAKARLDDLSLPRKRPANFNYEQENNRWRWAHNGGKYIRGPLQCRNQV